MITDYARSTSLTQGQHFTVIMASSSVPLFSIPPPTAVNDTHKVYSVAIGIILIGIFTTITVALRLLYRFYKKKNGLDDYAIIVSLVGIS